ncbi:MAG: GAF domain-containing protein [Deltaproteobacteria bacterium]|nr:MAG: GAF domain-containing protein [Deltaproteobacteria bacterium]
MRRVDAGRIRTIAMPFGLAVAALIPFVLSDGTWLGRPQATILLLALLAGVLALDRRREKLRCQALDRELAAARAQVRRTNDELAEAHRRQRQMLDWAGDAVLFIDPATGRLLDQNRQALKLLGASASDLQDLPVLQLLADSNRHRYLELLDRVRAQGYGEDDALDFLRRDKTRFTGAIHARMGRLGRQRVIHATLRDVTAYRAIEQELRQKNRDLALLNSIAHQSSEIHDLQELLDTTLASIAEAMEADAGGIFLLRHGGNDLYFAARYRVPDEVYRELSQMQPGQGLAGAVATTGHPRSSVDLQTDQRTWARSVANTSWRGFQAVPVAARDRTRGVLCLCSNRKRVFRRDEVQLLLAVGKQLGGAIEGVELLETLRWQNRINEAANRELTESRRRLKENLKRQEEATRTLERLERMKNNFLALASHELRTPLTCILTGTELMGERSDNLLPDQTRLLEAIRQGGERLREIVDNLLEVARLEAQSIYLGREAVDLPLLLQRVEEDVRPLVQASNLRFELELPGSIEGLWGDADHLHRTLERVIENAIKFTPEGGIIRVGTRRLTGDDIEVMRPALEPFTLEFFNRPLAESYLCIDISDSGIGIDPEELPRIFDKFYEIGDISDHHTSRTRFGGKGVGLGLTLARGMIEAHGGMIWATSEGIDRGGSEFHLLLPLSSVDKRQPAELET